MLYQVFYHDCVTVSSSPENRIVTMLKMITINLPIPMTDKRFDLINGVQLGTLEVKKSDNFKLAGTSCNVTSGFSKLKLIQH